MHDNWIRGTANGKYTIEMAGFLRELGRVFARYSQFNLRDGVFPILRCPVPSTHAAIYRILDFRGPGSRCGKQLWIHRARALLSTVLPPMSKKLDFNLCRRVLRPSTFTGTLSDPQVTPANRAETRAALKP